MNMITSAFANATTPRIDPVQFVLNNVGVNVATKGYTNTPTGNMDAIKHGTNALELFREAKMALAAQLPQNSQQSSTNNIFNNSGQIMGQLASTATTIAVGAVAGPAAAAAVALTSAAMEGAQFLHTGTTHAAVDGAVGEMGLNEKGGYRDILGDTYTMSGEKIEPIVVKPASQQLIDPQKMGTAVDAAFAIYTPKQIMDSIQSIGTQEQALIAQVDANIAKIGDDGNVKKEYFQSNADIFNQFEVSPPQFARKPTISAPHFPTLG